MGLGWDRGLPWSSVFNMFKNMLTVTYTDYDGWHAVSKLRPRYWQGKRMRRWNYDRDSIGGAYDGQWMYYTFEECANEVLRERCDLPDAAYIHAREWPGDIGI